MANWKISEGKWVILFPLAVIIFILRQDFNDEGIYFNLLLSTLSTLRWVNFAKKSTSKLSRLLLEISISLKKCSYLKVSGIYFKPISDNFNSYKNFNLPIGHNFYAGMLVFEKLIFFKLRVCWIVVGIVVSLVSEKSSLSILKLLSKN